MFLLGVGRVGHQISQMHPLRLRLLLVGQDAHGDFHKVSAQRQENQRGHYIEQGVHVGDLGCGVGRSQGLHERGQRSEHTDKGKENGAKDIEHQVDNGGALGIAAGADRGQHGR